MTFSLRLNAMRSAFGILFVVLASVISTSAIAQDLAQPSEANVRLADPLDRNLVQSVVPGDNAKQSQSGDPLRWTLSANTQVSPPIAPVPEQQQPAAPPCKNWPSDRLDEWNGPSWSCCQPFCADPCCSVYGQVQALLLTRGSGFSNRPIVVAGAAPGTTFLSTSDINPNFTPGVQATFGMPLRGGWGAEFDYFSLFPGNASAGFANSPGGGLTFPGDVGGNVFQDLERVQLDYSSWLNSFALNFPCCCGCCEVCCDDCGCCQVGDGRGQVRSQSFSWFAGLRYLNFGDRLNITGLRTGGVPGEVGQYNVRTSNNLYGAQLGARMRRTQGRFGWDATGQAGVFGNDAQQTQFAQDFPPGDPGSVIRQNVSTSRGGVAFVGQGNLSGLYALTNVWNLRAGYNVIWVEGLALAPDQLDSNFANLPSGNQLNNNGGIFLHGVNVGLEARW